VAPVAERGGHHADDLVGLAVDANRTADDVGVAPEAVLPVAVGDDEDAMVAEDLFVGTEAAAELRSRPEGGKEIGGDAEAVGHLGRFAGFGEAHVRTGVGGNLAVAVHLGFQIEVVGRREAAARIPGSGAIDAVQEVAAGIGCRAQHVPIEDAEHRRVGADAESERDDGDQGEAGRAMQRLDGEADVTEDAGKLVHGVSARPPECRHRANLFRGATSRCMARLCAQAWALQDSRRLSAPDTQRSHNRSGCGGFTEIAPRGLGILDSHM
jgi:hypothetical protein